MRMPAITTRALRKKFDAPADNGFFGPGSVTWKVWGYPTSITCGFQRSVTIEELDPNLVAAVEKSGGIWYRPRNRYDRTLRYFALMVFGDTETTARAADVLVKVHSKAIGHDPVTGGTYDANAPHSQLWIHMTAWHSNLYVYETFGPGRLSEEEENQYWAECARSAELQTIDPATVPRNREEVRAYFEEWRPRLSGSEIAQKTAQHLLDASVVLPDDLPRWLRPFAVGATAMIGRQTMATYPRWMRPLLGVRQSRLTDAVVTMASKPAYAFLARVPAAQIAVLSMISPSTVPIAAPRILGIAAASEVTMTPREAQARYGLDAPAQAHLEFRAQQYERVFGQQQAPSDAGLTESQELIGALENGNSATAS